VVWEAGLDLSESHRVVLDYPEDYELIRRVFDALAVERLDFGVRDVARFLDEHPAIAAINARHRGSQWYRRQDADRAAALLEGAPQ